MNGGLYRFIGGLIITVFCLQESFALPDLRIDSSRVEVRSIPEQHLESYKSDKNFQYTGQLQEDLSLWDSFWKWFWQKIGALMEKKGFQVGMKIFLYLAPVIIFIYAILRFMGMEKVMLWISGNKNANPAFDIRDDNIYGVDFDQAIEEAVSQGRYRDATRLHYLKTLRNLSDRGLINWTKNKTNVDFARDLSGSALSAGFSDITRIYEYAWYGEFDVSETDYASVNKHFSQFEKQLPL